MKPPKENDYVMCIYTHTDTRYSGRVECGHSKFGFHICDLVTTKRGELINMPVISVFVAYNEDVKFINLGNILEI